MCSANAAWRTPIMGYQPNTFTMSQADRKRPRKGMSIALAKLDPRDALLRRLETLAQALVIAELPPHVHLRCCTLW
jgi:hypothetical protein